MSGAQGRFEAYTRTASLPAYRVAGAIAVMGFLSYSLQAHAFGKRSAANLEDQVIAVEAVAIPHFEKAQPEVTRFGRLEWRGGLVLTSPSTFFGGWSGLAIDAAGDRILGISDTGVWMTGRLSYDGSRPMGIVSARLGALRGYDGKPLRWGRDKDPEGVALLTGTLERGEVLISFERNHRIVRYPVTAESVGPPTAALELPAETRLLESNKGLEAICMLQSGPATGSVVTFAERFPGRDGRHAGWMRPPLTVGHVPGSKPAVAAWKKVSVQILEGYDITDCAGAPDGGLFLLERRFRVSYGDPLTGAKMRIRQISQSDLLTGTTIVGETLIEANGRHEIDNMEGLAVHTDALGRTILTLISDDNFNSYLQQTVLLQFAVADGPAAAVEERR
jgi:hypothetical protein